VIASPRSPDDRNFRFDIESLAVGADDYAFEVDNQIGVLLRVESRRDGQPFLIHEAVVIDFDTPIAPETFVFEPPPGEEIEPLPWKRPFLHDIPIHEAVERAPFGVLVPDRVPAEWELTVSFHPETERPPSAPSVHLHYRSRNGTSGVSVSETLEHDEQFGFDLHGDDPGWEDVERPGDVRMRLRPRSADWHQSQLALKRDGLSISMTSNDLAGGGGPTGTPPQSRRAREDAAR
jgi:hypothetical protein